MTATERSEQRNVILNDAFAAFMWLHADSDEAGHAFQSEAGQLFQREAGRDSDLKPATAASFAGSRLMMSWVGFSGQA
jgi:hypothetical protein